MTNRACQTLLGLAGAILLASTPSPVRGQEFVPPDRRGSQPTAPGDSDVPAPTGASGLRIDLLGFSTRAGVQVNKDQQVLLGSTLDIVQLWTPRLRLRPSFEVGFGRPATSLAVNAEVVYRFQPESSPAIPYLGLGAGYYDDATTERVWATMVMGFELPFRRSMNWLFEYHGLDAWRRSRFFVGLATRGSGR